MNKEKTKVDDVDFLKMLPGEENTREAWSIFLERYSRLILKIIWIKENDYDRAMEKYLYVCKKLSDDNFALFKKFDRDYPGDAHLFKSWLTTVIKNLCIDHHRKEYGRKRLPKLLQSMSETEQEFFRLYYWQGFSLDEIEKKFSTSGSSEERSAAGILHDIEEVYLNANRRTPERNTEINLQPYIENRQNVSASGDFEFLADLEKFFRYWVSKLPPKEQIVLQLRFWEGAAPLEIAEILNIEPPNKVYKVLKKGLEQLRIFYVKENQRKK